MQIYQPSTMAQTVKDIAELLSLNLGYNEIGSKGYEFLSQAKWAHFKSLELLSNNIRNEGVKHLRKGNWLLPQQNNGMSSKC